MLPQEKSKVKSMIKNFKGCSINILLIESLAVLSRGLINFARSTSCSIVILPGKCSKRVRAIIRVKRQRLDCKPELWRSFRR